jgi:protein-disulfide isomerase
VLVCHLAAAQEPTLGDLKKDIQALADLLKSVQRDLEQVKASLLPAQPPPSPQVIVLELENSPFKGLASAPVTLVEFTDYQCPFCVRHARDTLPSIEREYIVSGRLKYVLMDLPLESIHPLAFKGAETAHCAGEQGKYWEMHDRLFANQQTLADWGNHAQAVGLDVTRFNTCMSSGRRAAQVRGHLTQARATGLNGTPSFAIGFTDTSSSTLKVEALFSGALPFESFKGHIERLIIEAKTKAR